MCCPLFIRQVGIRRDWAVKDGARQRSNDSFLLSIRLVRLPKDSWELKFFKKHKKHEAALLFKDNVLGRSIQPRGPTTSDNRPLSSRSQISVVPSRNTRQSSFNVFVFILATTQIFLRRNVITSEKRPETCCYNSRTFCSSDFASLQQLFDSVKMMIDHRGSRALTTICLPEEETTLPSSSLSGRRAVAAQ
ncbi:hypothetical protein F2P81_017626 [Scophthalmus maximus]|uniref:Uncharacterized protein n=1 Tax=Scophthalmus maximus TaxID=52904 RepID=A0A6A4SED7_SCOMX|nr:hypothetical protein F2P81_017626 [Scophthalmus maximus]